MQGCQWKILGRISLLSMLLFASCVLVPNVAEDTGETFFQRLDSATRDQILWFSDFEAVDFRAWEDYGTSHEHSGGGLFITSEARVGYSLTRELSHSGQRALRTQLQGLDSPGEPAAIRFMRWTDRSWDTGGSYFPMEAYYSVFVFFPRIFNPGKPQDQDPLGDGGWWNIFQFKSDNHVGSHPMVELDVYNNDSQMYLGMVVKDYPDDGSGQHTQVYMKQDAGSPLVPGRWIHLEVFYRRSSTNEGVVQVWQDGASIHRMSGIRTQLPPSETVVWGIGNYTDYTQEGEAMIFFDDAAVSLVPLGH